jgi:hypothetical protein
MCLRQDPGQRTRQMDKRGPAEQWIKEGKEVTHWTRLFKTGGRLVRHARYFILQLAESNLTQRLFA